MDLTSLRPKGSETESMGMINVVDDNRDVVSASLRPVKRVMCRHEKQGYACFTCRHSNPVVDDEVEVSSLGVSSDQSIMLAPGLCYLLMFREEARAAVRSIHGTYPRFSDLLHFPAFWFREKSEMEAMFLEETSPLLHLVHHVTYVSLMRAFSIVAKGMSSPPISENAFYYSVVNDITPLTNAELRFSSTFTYRTRIGGKEAVPLARFLADECSSFGHAITAEEVQASPDFPLLDRPLFMHSAPDKQRVRMLEVCGDAMITRHLALTCFERGVSVQEFQTLRSSKTSNKSLSSLFVQVFDTGWFKFSADQDPGITNVGAKMFEVIVGFLDSTLPSSVVRAILDKWQVFGQDFASPTLSTRVSGLVDESSGQEFSYGFCYLLAFREGSRKLARMLLGESPTIDQLLSMSIHMFVAVDELLEMKLQNSGLHYHLCRSQFGLSFVDVLAAAARDATPPPSVDAMFYFVSTRVPISSLLVSSQMRVGQRSVNMNLAIYGVQAQDDAREEDKERICKLKASLLLVAQRGMFAFCSPFTFATFRDIFTTSLCTDESRRCVDSIINALAAAIPLANPTISYVATSGLICLKNFDSVIQMSDELGDFIRAFEN